MNGEALLEVAQMTKRFGNVEALAGVSLTLGAGERVAVVGRNGCGKSTLLKGIGCLLQMEWGDASLAGETYLKNGRVIKPLTTVRSQIVTVLQNTSLFPNMTVLGNLTFAPMKVLSLPKAEAERCAKDMSLELGVGMLLDRYPHQLSGGQAQKVGIARALLMRPKVLLLDEITSALDPESILAIIDALETLKEMPETARLGIVFVTHLMRFASEFADRIAFMDAGRMIESLPAKLFFEQCRTSEARSFVAANRIPY